MKYIMYKRYYVQYFRSFHLYHELDILVQSQSYSIKNELWLIWTVNSTPGRTAKTIAFRRLGPGLDTVDLNQHILLLFRLGHYSSRSFHSSFLRLTSEWCPIILWDRAGPLDHFPWSPDSRNTKISSVVIWEVLTLEWSFIA